jgi:hypothetical protein
MLCFLRYNIIQNFTRIELFLKTHHYFMGFSANTQAKLHQQKRKTGSRFDKLYYDKTQKARSLKKRVIGLYRPGAEVGVEPTRSCPRWSLSPVLFITQHIDLIEIYKNKILICSTFAPFFI